ncbi:pirin family protein [Idiomarina xiamenensis]|uniref:Pirin domain-containing protein n=1 Tax=Idiomarina xiamenensis 10-D-4 TaxID=740709 RepID=K2LAI1_9GAMM|nr:pirin family protein [Idiomarina xiamenensis]EKE86835.1 pirin domain-containing protein [Idiomarina xiamenensis 10-D-4]
MTRHTQDDQQATCERHPLQRHWQTLDAAVRPLTAAINVYRAIPQRQLRNIGPWCFIDQMGPVALADYDQFDVAPHPHIGLQTITWLFSGQLLHKDSLGNEQPLLPGELNLMTSGHGISHAEQVDEAAEKPLHGMQLWLALPEHKEDMPPAFEHHRELPLVKLPGVSARLILGSYEQWQSPAKAGAPCTALALYSPRPSTLTLQLKPEFEYGLYVCDGQLRVDDEDSSQSLHKHQLLYVGGQRKQLTIALGTDSQVMLLGGEPLAKPLHMFWNFVAYDGARIRQAHSDWQQGHARFGRVANYAGTRLSAPAIPTAVKW